MSDRPSVENLSDIFLQVADAPVGQREEMLAELCPDEATRRQVRQLLEADATVDPLLDHALFPEPAEMRAGDRVAGYELVEEIAHGGMGIVYLAEQVEPIRRRVALKVIKPGVDTREVIARFNAERQALSLMDHPNIAKVFDAGSTEAGRPFFVMELVDGKPINAHCEAHRLSIKQRLEVFVSVCRAIQHAHQKGIIHRDIKPSNVLVAQYDDQPIAKVIDFGVAKAINQTVSQVTVATGLGRIVGTFDYMSPEQSRLNQRDVDTRSDIYSLGVLLYELITETPPFDRERLRSVGLDEMLQIIQNEEPPRPSVRLTSLRIDAWADSPTKFAEPHEDAPPKSGTTPNSGREKRRREQQLRRQIRTVQGELDWIVMKAMDKDPDRRYSTPDDFARDIERFLDGDAVEACPPSALYRLGKFANRNRTTLAASGALVVALLLATIGVAYHLVQVSTAKSAANIEALEFFIEELLGLDESWDEDGYTPDPDVSLLRMLKNAESRIDQRLAESPQLRVKVKSMLARSLNGLGQYDDAERLYREYLEFLAASKGFADPETIRVMERLVRLHLDESRFDDAAQLAEDALRYSRSYLGEEHEITLQLLNDRATLHFRRNMRVEAVENYRLVLEARSRLLGEAHPDTLETMSNLAAVLDSLGEFGEAQMLYESVARDFRATLPPSDARLAAAFQQLGKCYLKLGRRTESPVEFKKAAELLRESLDIYSRNRGPDHTDTLESQYQLANALFEHQQLDRAQELLVDLVNRLQRLRKPDDPTTLSAMNLLGWTHFLRSQPLEAELVLMNVSRKLRRRSVEDRLTIQVMGNLAIVRYSMGKHEEAASLDEKTLKLANKVLGDNHAETLSIKARLGLAYLDLEQVTEGRALLSEVYQQRKGLAGSSKILAALESDVFDEIGSPDQKAD